MIWCDCQRHEQVSHYIFITDGQSINQFCWADYVAVRKVMNFGLGWLIFSELHLWKASLITVDFSWLFQQFSDAVGLFSGAFAELWKATVSFVMSLSAWSNFFPLGEFSWKLIFDYFSKICREYSNIITNWQE